jgi:hypothetical protein
MKNCATIRRSDRSPRTSGRSSKSAALSAGDGESQNRHVRLLRGALGSFVLIAVAASIGLPVRWGATAPIISTAAFQDHGRSDELRAPQTNHASVFEPPVNRWNKLAVGTVYTLRSQLFQGRIDMLRKITIASITLAAVSLDPLLARMEGWWRYLRRRRRRS